MLIVLICFEMQIFYQVSDITIWTNIISPLPYLCLVVVFLSEVYFVKTLQSKLKQYTSSSPWDENF